MGWRMGVVGGAWIGAHDAYLQYLYCTTGCSVVLYRYVPTYRTESENRFLSSRDSHLLTTVSNVLTTVSNVLTTVSNY